MWPIDGLVHPKVRCRRLENSDASLQCIIWYSGAGVFMQRCNKPPGSWGSVGENFEGEDRCFLAEHAVNYSFFGSATSFGVFILIRNDLLSTLDRKGHHTCKCNLLRHAQHAILCSICVWNSILCLAFCSISILIWHFEISKYVIRLH